MQSLAISADFAGNWTRLSSLAGGRECPHFASALSIFTPIVTVGVSALKSKEGASENSATGTSDGNSSSNSDTEEVEPFYQAGFRAVLHPQGHFSASLNYMIGRSPSAGGQPGGNSQNGQDRSIDQQLSLGGSFLLPPIPRIQFGFGVNFAGLSGTSRDVGGAADRDIATLSLSAAYAYSQKTNFDWGVSFPIRSFTNGVSSSGPEMTFSVRNQITKKSNIGLSLTVGSLSTEVQGDPNLLRPDETVPNTDQSNGEGAGNSDTSLKEGPAGRRPDF
jgi:hypothetical protein